MTVFTRGSLAIVFSLILFFKVFLDIDFLTSTISTGDCGETDGWTLLQWITFLSLVAILLGVILSVKKSKVGWCLLMAFAVYAFFNLSKMALVDLGFLSFSRTFDYPAVPIFDPITAGACSILFVALIYGFSQRNLREEFRMSQNFVVAVISLQSLLFLALFLFF